MRLIPFPPVTGAIDAGELSIAMQALGFNPTTGEIAKMMKDIDTDGNATVEFEEFVEMMEGKMVSAATLRVHVSALPFSDHFFHGRLVRTLWRR